MKLKTRTLLVLSFAVPLLLLTGWLWLLDTGGVAELAAARERNRAAGLPTTIEEILPPYVADADNAAPLIARFSTTPLGSSLMVKFCQDGLKPTPAELDKLAEEFDSAPMLAELRLIREAAAKPGYDARVKYELGRMPKFADDLSPLLDAAKLLRAHARLVAGQGQTEEACAEIWDLLQLGDFEVKELTLLSQLVRQAIWKIALENLGRLAETGGISPAWNQKFSERLAATSLNKDLARSLDAEGIIFGPELILSGTMPLSEIFGKSPGWQTWLKIQKYRFRGVVRAEYADNLDWLREASLALTQPSMTLPELTRRLNAASAAIKPDELLVKAALVNLAHAIEGTWPLRAKVAIAQVGLALERYRAAKGEYPATLAALVPEVMPAVPVDVFTGAPLHYERVPGGAVVHSVGPDLKDNGGKGDDLAWHAGKAAELPADGAKPTQ